MLGQFLLQVLPHHSGLHGGREAAIIYRHNLAHVPKVDGDAPSHRQHAAIARGSLATGHQRDSVLNRPLYQFHHLCFVPWLNEAARLLDEGVANIPTIDEAARETFRIGMGPFELMNVTGIPIAVHASTTLGNELGPFYATAESLKAQMEKQENWDLSGEVDESLFEGILEPLRGIESTNIRGLDHFQHGLKADAVIQGG